MDQSLLELRFHFGDGSITSFTQNDERAALRILGGIKGRRIFDVPFLHLAGDYSITGIDTGGLERIEILTDLEYGWPLLTDLDALWEVDEASFKEHAHSGGYDDECASDRSSEVGQSSLGFMILDFLSGARSYLAFEARSREALEQCHVTSEILAAPNLHANIDGGVVLINAHAIESVSMVPGPRSLPEGVWYVDDETDDQVADTTLP